MAKKTKKALETQTIALSQVGAMPAGIVPAGIVAATTGVVAAGTQAAKDKMAAIRAMRGTGDNDNDVFTFIPFTATATIPADPRKKLAPQAMVCVNGVASLPNGTGTRAALEKAITGVLVTKQPVGRIVTYYQKAMVENGYITLVKAPPIIPAVVPATK